MGRRFFIYSLIGMVIFSGAVGWIDVSLPVHDMLSSALLAGIISGVGSGIILRSSGSAGGTDILSVALLKRFDIRLGSTTLAFNSGVLAAGAVLFPLEKALYTLIYIYVCSRVLNLVVTGLRQRKAVYIISPSWEEISHRILENINRGVAMLQGYGAFPVVENKRLVGMVTESDIVRMMTRVLGVKEKGKRIDIRTHNKFGNMKKIMEILDKNKTVLLSMMTLPPEEWEKDWLVMLRLKSDDAGPIAMELGAADFNVTYVG